METQFLYYGKIRNGYFLSWISHRHRCLFLFQIKSHIFFSPLSPENSFSWLHKFTNYDNRLQLISDLTFLEERMDGLEIKVWRKFTHSDDKRRKKFILERIERFYIKLFLLSFNWETINFTKGEKSNPYAISFFQSHF